MIRAVIGHEGRAYQPGSDLYILHGWALTKFQSDTTMLQKIAFYINRNWQVA